MEHQQTRCRKSLAQHLCVGACSLSCCWGHLLSPTTPAIRKSGLLGDKTIGAKTSLHAEFLWTSGLWPEGNFARPPLRPREHLPTFGGIFSCPNCLCVCYWNLVGRDQGCCSTSSYNAQDTEYPQQRIIRFQMSIVLWFRKPAVKQTALS